MPESLQRLFAVILLIMTSPILLVAVCWVRLTSHGPVVFRQKRIGLEGHEFILFKIRTMRTGQVHSSMTTVADDKRIIGGGHVLRKFKIDELPQLLNVIRGDMNLVGPRPTVALDVDQMTDEQRRRHQVRPGLTGLAQISGNTSLAWPERLTLDLQYIEERSTRVDIAILLKTIWSVIARKADTHPTSDGEWEAQP